MTWGHLPILCGWFALLCAAPASSSPLPIGGETSTVDHTAARNALSPDGMWLAHTYTDGTPLDLQDARGAMQFTSTGVPPLDFRIPHARLTQTSTGETIELARANVASWGPSWSPDGTRLAFFSDEGGEQGLWIWSAATRTAVRIPGVIPRPHLAGQIARWSPDGRQLLLTVLPEGMTVAEANARIALSRPGAKQNTGALTQPGPNVIVYHHPERAGDSATGEAAPPQYPIDLDRCDLAILDLAGGQVRRIHRDTRTPWFAWSPAGAHVAFTASRGIENASTNQILFDLNVVDLDSGASRTLVSKIRFSGGAAVSWSPDGRRLGYCTGGRGGSRACFVVDRAGGTATELGIHGHRLEAIAGSAADTAPLWAADGQSLFLTGQRTVFQLPVDPALPAKRLQMPDREMTVVIASRSGITPWSSDGGRSIWISTRSDVGSGIVRWQPATGAHTVVFQDDLFHTFSNHVHAAPGAGRMLFLAEGPSVPQELFLFDTAARTKRMITRFHPAARHALGRARRLEWNGEEGVHHEAMLLLPPDHRDGQRHPLIVWLYPGDVGVEMFDHIARYRYALGWSAAVFDFHVAATRGYAILYPRVPLRPGRQAEDLTRIVLAAVDVAAARGFADPDRLAVWGHSYGAYAAQLLITQTDRFKAAVTTGNVMHPDLVSAYLGDHPQSTSPGYFETGQGRLLAQPWQDRERYLRNSPAFHFDRVQTPLLMGQGTQDSAGMGALAPANAIFVGLRRLDKTVELRVYEGEGHAITRRANVEDFWRRRLEFTAEHLGLTQNKDGGISH
jgi:dipeptidyl aminopeptidase/acylaminoacyl peptidase